MDKKKLVICAAFESAASRLPEWLAYHSVVGVEHFVLYDSSGSAEAGRVIRNSALADQVTLIRWPQRPGPTAAYRHFIDIFAPGFEWVAFLDLDEFLLPLSSRSVLDTLDWLSSAAAVLVHRRVFAPGPSVAPAGLVIEAHDRRAADDFPANRHVRVIARCSELMDVTENPHEFLLNGSVFNTAGYLAPNVAVQQLSCHLNLVVNQYCSGPHEAWLARLQRESGAADAGAPQDAAAQNYESATLFRLKDDTIQSFAPDVRRLLGFGGGAFPGMATMPGSPPGPAQTRLVPEHGPVVVEQRPVTGQGSVVGEPALVPEQGPVVVERQVVVPEPDRRVAEPEHSSADSAMARPEPEAAESELSVVPLGPGTVEPGSPELEPVTAPLTGADAVVWSAPPEPPPAVAMPLAAPQGWVPRGRDAMERVGGLGMVFRDRSRPGEHWLAALRGAAAVAAIDPAFLVDEFDRIRDFPDDVQARAACDAALAQGQ